MTDIRLHARILVVQTHFERRVHRFSLSIVEVEALSRGSQELEKVTGNHAGCCLGIRRQWLVAGTV